MVKLNDAGFAVGGPESAAREHDGAAAGRDERRAEPSHRDEHRADASGRTVTCGFCGERFVEDRTQATCQACPLSKACGLMRCPHCGYENAREPAWISRIKEWIR